MVHSLPLVLPVGRSAQRPRWSDLPAGVRSRLERALGARVVAAQSQGSGFTPGFASRLRLADGRLVFVKAADDGQPWLAESYRSEAAKLALLPASVPAPRLQQLIDEPVGDQGWVLLVFADLPGRPPQRPWSPDEARSAMRLAAELAEALTPPPPGWPWQTLAELIVDETPDWTSLGDPPGWGEHLHDLVELAERRSDLLGGNTLNHSDLRDDNLIVAADGALWVCDWNWPTVGPSWGDTLSLAISMSGDGLDADQLVAGTGQVTEDDREAVDCLLAALTGYYLLASARPVVPTSPHLRTHQAWYAEAAGRWLKQRRGWT